MRQNLRMTTHRAKRDRRFLRNHVLWFGPGYYFCLRPGLGLSYALPGGWACLREEATPANINGIWINTRWGITWFLFRRVR